MRVLISGNSGFIGKEMVRFLSESTDCEIFTLGCSTSALNNHIKIEGPEDRVTINNAIKVISPHKIFHLAGSYTAQTFPELYAANVTYPTSIIESVKQCKNDDCAIYLFGSAAEYGLSSSSGLPLSEEMVCKPVSKYGVSKYMQTLMANLHCYEGSNVHVFRLFNVIGPGIPKTLFVRKLIDKVTSALATGRKELIFDNIYSHRDLLDVRDLVKIIWKLSTHETIKYTVINLCQGKAVNMCDVLSYIVSQACPELKIIMKNDERKLDVSFGDTSRLRQYVSNYNFIDWRQSIDDMLSLEVPHG